MIRALLFDAAGTLIDPAESVGKTYARLLFSEPSPDLAADLDRRFRDAFRRLPAPDFAADPDGDRVERVWWRELVASTLERPLDDAGFATVFDHYAGAAAWRIRPGVIDALERARAGGFRLAVVSNFDRRLHAILENLGLARFFEHQVCSADARARKPDPAIFRHALELLDLGADEVLHVGDSPKCDGRGAAAAGIGVHLLRSADDTLGGFVARVENLR